MEQSLHIGVTTPALVRVDAVEIAAFCQRHKLDEDMCQLFVAKALDPPDCLFEFNDDELRNGNHYFTDTYIAALRVAVKKALSEKDLTVRVITPKEEDTDGGSFDEAQMPALFVALFTRVQIGERYLGMTGGRGGRGGKGTNGRGKDGESQEIAFLIFSYHEEPRFGMLAPSEVPANLRQLIMDGEFQFVGGLFEASDTDMQS
ncbi:hypothetical protein C8R45DRAFT_1014043, partial [Mycena sanguinolenta]